ncbi:MAG: aminotransferase class I/II-fold pyridoxal phosphate-dependent enzyme, partial [Solirubrobacterales bacterium]
ENLKVVNAALRERRDALVDALREHIPEAQFVVPEGGYFLWLDLNDDVDSKVLLAEAKEEGVTFVAGPDFMMEGGDSSLRLSFAPVPAQDVADGVQRLARALERTREGASSVEAA